MESETLKQNEFESEMCAFAKFLFFLRDYLLTKKCIIHVDANHNM